MTLMKLSGRTALVTGAASGIGRALAVALARRGTNLALADVNEAGLDEPCTLAATSSVRVSAHRLDVGDAAAIAAFPEQIAASHPGIDLLINNAGVALGGSFEQTATEDFEWLFSINFWGVVRMTRAFLPMLHRSDDARIVNVSSIFGIVAPPGQTAYSASKFAVRGFSESLRRELARTPIGVTTVHPGGVATSIAKNARAAKDIPAEVLARQMKGWERMLRLPPESAAETIVRAVERRRARVLVGNDAKLAALAERLFPTSYRL
jgi:NAD(P)-dependent dehydrogenase (short-subunit alcohol dehydrogenase family)